MRIQTAASQFELPPSEDPPPSQQDVDLPTEGPPPATGVTAPLEVEAADHIDVSASEPQEGAGQLPDERGMSPVAEGTVDSTPTATAADRNEVRCPCGFHEVRPPHCPWHVWCRARGMLPLVEGRALLLGTLHLSQLALHGGMHGGWGGMPGPHTLAYLALINGTLGHMCRVWWHSALCRLCGVRCV